jgi:hypothetical protein
MLVEAVGSAIITAKLQGGKISKLQDIEINKWWLITSAALIEFSASTIRAREIEPLWRWIDQYVLIIQVFSYTLIIISLLCNIKNRGVKGIVIGVLLNLLVIIANGGRMPVDISGFDPVIYSNTIEILIAGRDLTHEVVSETTNLYFLADIIHLKRPYPLPKSLSVGDLFIMAGIFMYIRNKVLDDVKSIRTSSGLDKGGI